MIYNEVLLTRKTPSGNANRRIFCAAGNNKKIISKTVAFCAKLWYLCLPPRRELIQWPRNAPTVRAISASGQMADGRAATPQDTTQKQESASSKTFSARRRRSARQSWPLLWRSQRASTSAAPTNTPWLRGCGAGTTSTLGHYDAGFTLRTYTHATRQKQDEAARTMGGFMTQVM